MQCLWCQNPEAVKFENELVYTQERCILCGECEKACPNGAITITEHLHIDRILCAGEFVCAFFCPSKALDMIDLVLFDIKAVTKVVSKNIG